MLSIPESQKIISYHQNSIIPRSTVNGVTVQNQQKPIATELCSPTHKVNNTKGNAVTTCLPLHHNMQVLEACV
jgi:hypothetical protein